MDYEKKIRNIKKQIRSGKIPFPDSLRKNKVDHLVIANSVAFFIQTLSGDPNNSAIKKASKEEVLKKFLDSFSVKECAFLISSNEKR